MTAAVKRHHYSSGVLGIDQSEMICLVGKFILNGGLVGHYFSVYKLLIVQMFCTAIYLTKYVSYSEFWIA